MLVATFNATTGWAGKTITHDAGVFSLEGHGPITAADVMAYDRQGFLSWTNAGTRAWVGSKAGVRPSTAPPTDEAIEPVEVSPASEVRAGLESEDEVLAVPAHGPKLAFGGRGGENAAISALAGTVGPCPDRTLPESDGTRVSLGAALWPLEAFPERLPATASELLPSAEEELQSQLRTLRSGATPAERMAAARALGKTGDRRFVEPLGELLLDEWQVYPDGSRVSSPGLHKASAEALANIGGAQSVGLLGLSLLRGGVNAQYDAAALGRIGGPVAYDAREAGDQSRVGGVLRSASPRPRKVSPPRQEMEMAMRTFRSACEATRDAEQPRDWRGPRGVEVSALERRR
jgi:hypothetical protein